MRNVEVPFNNSKKYIIILYFM